MKIVFKYLFVFAGLLFIIILSCFLFKGFVVSNLKDKTRHVDSKWSELFQCSSDRILILNKLTSHLPNSGIVLDSLKLSIENNFSNRSNYENECSLNFVNQEYHLNKQYLEFLKTYKKDSALRLNEIDTLVEQLKSSEVKINEIVGDYNNKTLDLNRYISVFPNFYFAKRYGFYKKKFFTVKYGVENEDPVAKSKELPQWAKEKDTL